MRTEVWALLSCWLTLNPEFHFETSLTIPMIAPLSPSAPWDTPLRSRQWTGAESPGGCR